MQRIDGFEALEQLSGQQLGASPWLCIDQDRIQAFADATGDHQWIHLDRERAARESPWGTTVAHGFLTLSLLPALNQQVFGVDGVAATINYGLDRVRFTAPVPSGARIRSQVRLLDCERQDDQRLRARFESRIEIEGQERPACVAEHIAVFVRSVDARIPPG